jgi:hypothetical protein
MIVVEVGVKTECKIYGCRSTYKNHQNDVLNWVQNNSIQVSQKWRTNYLLPYRGCLNVHEKNMKKIFPQKKSIIFIIIINDNTM